MNRKTPKTAIVAFKVEQELADLLNNLPNKSDFIRKAIAAQLGVPCPLCKGGGVVSRGISDRFLPLVEQFRNQNCQGCGTKIEIPIGKGDMDTETYSRLEQYLLGGPLYCNSCYSQAPACDDCGWHIDKEHTQQHHLVSHCSDHCETHSHKTED
ncbi:MAG: hypothetical protein ACK47R_26015 [Planctomycetia bacterium]|jgi:hypothetical protein